MAVSAIAGLAGALGTGAAAIAAGGAFWATVFSTAGIVGFAIGAGLSVVSRALMPKVNTGIDMSGLQQTVRSPIDSRKLVYGQMRLGGTIVYINTEGTENRYLHLAIAFASHEVESFENIYFNDKKVWENGSLLTTDYRDYTSIRVYDGTQTTADSVLDNQSTNWTPDHVLNGIAYVAVRLDYNVEAFANGIPNISATIKGKKVFDPRTSTTAWSANPALVLYDYLRDTSYGLGEPSTAFDVNSVIAAANICDEDSDTLTAGVQTRYECNGVVDTAVKIKDNIEAITSSMAGFVTFSSGVYHIYAGAYRAPLSEVFDEKYLVGDIQLATKQSRRSQYNAVKGIFISAGDDYIATDYPAQISSTYALEDGEPIYLDMPLPMTTDQVMAQRIAKLALLRSRQQKVITLPMNMAALKFKAGDTIKVSNEKLGFDEKVFEVVGYELAVGEQFVVNVQAIETGPEIYDWTTDDEQPYEFKGEIPIYDGTPIPPTNLVLNSQVFEAADGTYSAYIDITWEASVDAFVDFYRLTYTVDGVLTSLDTRDTSHRIIAASLSEYSVSVTAINLLGRESAAITAGITPSSDITAPSLPTNLAAVGGIKTITLTWDNPTEKDFKHVQVFVNTTDSIPDTPSALIDGESFVLSGLSGGDTRYFWLKSVDFTNNVSNATSSVSASATKLDANDFDSAQPVIDIDFFVTDLQNKINDAVQTIDYNADIGDVYDAIALKANTADVAADLSLKADTTDLSIVENDVAFIRDETLTQADLILSDALLAHQNAKNLIDAGITTNPSTGEVYIYGFETYKGATDSRLDLAEIRLDGAEANINLKASTTYVDQAIASANFDPSQVADLTDLYARVSQAEIDIDGAEAAILLKVNQTEFDGAEGRLTTAEGEIDVLQGEIILKATTAQFDAIEDRVTDAEIAITSIDGANIALTVKDVRRLTERVDVAEYNSLESVLNAYNDRKGLREDIAFAQFQISADVDDLRNAEASARLELQASIDQNLADLVSEQIVRANETLALASDITTLSARVGTNEADITEANTLILDANSVIAQNKLEIDARLDDAEGNILQLNTVDLSSTSTLVQNHLSVEGRVTSAEGRLTDAEAAIVLSEGEINKLNTVDGTSDSILVQAHLELKGQVNDPVTGLPIAIGEIEKLNTIDGSSDSVLVQDYLSLKGQVNDPDTGLAAATGLLEEISTLDVNSDSVLVQSYNALSGAVNDPNTGLAKATADITDINTVDINSDSIIAQTVAQLDIDLGDLSGAVTNLSDVVAGEGSIRANDIKSLAVSTGYEIDSIHEQSMSTILQGYKDRKELAAELAIARQSMSADISSEREATAQYRLELLSAIDNSVALINQEATTRANADSAQAQLITELSAEIDTANASIVSEQVARANADGALASDITTLSGRVGSTEGSITQLNFVNAESDSLLVQAFLSAKSTLDGNTSTIEQKLESENGVFNQYSLTIDNNGAISGFGLVSDIIDGEPTSSFVVDADSFSIGSEGNYPFVVYTVPTTIDGVTYAAGVYIKDASIQTLSANKIKLDNTYLDTDVDGNLIISVGGVDTTQLADGAVTNAKINDLDASKITAGQIDTARLNVSEIITTGSIVVGDDITNFITGSDVNSNVTAISGGVITTGTINASRINIDGVTLSTSGDQLIINGGGVDTTQLALESASAARAATGSKTSWAAINTWYDICSITLDEIADTNMIINVLGSFSNVPVSTAQVMGLRILKGTDVIDIVAKTKGANEYTLTYEVPILTLVTPTATETATYKLQAYVSNSFIDLVDSVMTILQVKR